MNIRKMQASDLDSVMTLGVGTEQFMTTSDSASFWSSEQVSRSIAPDTDVLLVAEEEGKVIGFTIALLHVPTGKATFENLLVDPSQRGKGVGQALIEATVSELKKKGCTYICVLTQPDNVPTLKLFTRAGFTAGFNFTWLSR